MPKLDTLHIILSITAVGLGIIVLVSKGFLTAMKEKFMTTDERGDFLTKDEFEKECPEKQSVCAREICTKIQEIRNGQVMFKSNLQTIEDKVDDNLDSVKEEIGEVKKDLKVLTTTMQTELKDIAHFVGAVEQFLLKNGYQK